LKAVSHDVPSPDAETELSTYLVAARVGEEIGRQIAKQTRATVNISDLIINPVDRVSMVAQDADPPVPYLPLPRLKSKILPLQEGSHALPQKRRMRKRSRQIPAPLNCLILQ